MYARKREYRIVCYDQFLLQIVHLNRDTLKNYIICGWTIIKTSLAIVSFFCLLLQPLRLVLKILIPIYLSSNKLLNQCTRVQNVSVCIQCGAHEVYHCIMDLCGQGNAHRPHHTSWHHGIMASNVYTIVHTVEMPGIEYLLYLVLCTVYIELSIHCVFLKAFVHTWMDAWPGNLGVCLVFY